MSLRGTWYALRQNVPTPAWVRFPNRQRFCGFCSIRTGASVIGWFNFIFNSLYIGMLLLAIRGIRNEAEEIRKKNDVEESSGLEPTPTEPVIVERITAVIDFTLPIMYKSISIPGIMIIFSILWLITVEARNITYVRLFGRAFILSIFVQLVSQLGFLIYVEIKIRAAYQSGINAVVWIVYTVYALLNIYFVPVISEYIRRRRRECEQGMEQGLLTSEMYPRARVAEEYIQDAFTVEPDTDMVQFEASLVRTSPSEKSEDTGYQQMNNSDNNFDGNSPI